MGFAGAGFESDIFDGNRYSVPKLFSTIYRILNEPASAGTSMVKRIGVVLGLLVTAVAVGVIQYRGPAPKGMQTPPDQPAAARMRETLESLLGEPPQTHQAGSAEGEAFLSRLEQRIDSFNVPNERITLPWGDEPDSPELILKNLLATIPGRDPTLKPILIATHHDSCPNGPGAGDAGSAVVALVENIRLLSRKQPLRTTLFLFTDGEELGLLGAAAIAALPELPFPEPVFVLNLDARGTTGGVPMFETHEDNYVWTKRLIQNLAPPKITSSLAVTIYRMLPNGTDFDVWNSDMHWPGFNFATIGSAHHYHRPSDSPENVSDRTLQHMGDHIHAMHRALDVKEFSGGAEDSGSAVFFDVFGFFVIHHSEQTQKIFGVAALLILVVLLWFERKRFSIGAITRHTLAVVVLLVIGWAIGSGVNLLLKATPWAGVGYTPFDYHIGLGTIATTVLVTTFVMESFGKQIAGTDTEFLRDWTWFATAAIGVLLAFFLPGGAYLFVWPAVGYAVLRLMWRESATASWIGWIITAVLAGPVLALLVQALGPWDQPIYAVIATLLAIQALSVWWVHRPVLKTNA